MNTLQLRSFLRRYDDQDPDLKIRVCAIDQLPTKLKNGFAYGFVVNLSKISEPGSHWVSLYIDKKRNAFFFDSFGFKPKSYQLIDFIKKNSKRIYYNTRQLQQLNSKVCGMYAACCIIHLVKGHSFNEYIGKFSKNLLINDSFIIKNFRYYLRN